MESETEDENDIHFQSDNMNRTTLKKKIQDHGGKVLDKFPSGDDEKIPNNIVILSDKACKTMTYLLGIAYGFPTINFVWVINCCMGKELLPMQNYRYVLFF